MLRKINNIWATAWQNQQKDLCTQQRLRSAWTSAQSDHSLCCALNGWLRTQGFFKRTAKTLIRLGTCQGWSESLLGAYNFFGFSMRWLIYYQRTSGPENAHLTPDLCMHHYYSDSTLLEPPSWQNQQNDLCTQRRLRSAWASAQSDQSLRCLHEESLGP